MKKLLGIIISFLLWYSGISQIYLPVVPKDYGANFNRIKPFQVLHIPFGDTASLYTTDTSAQLKVMNGQLYYHSGYWRPAGGSGASGTINGITMNFPGVIYNTPVNFTVANGTATGNVTFTNQSPNLVFASPNGAIGTPTFRALTTADLPAPVIPNLQSVTSTGNTTTTSIAALNFDVSHSQIITQFTKSLISHDTVKHNLAIGYYNMINGTTGQWLTAIGDSALYSNTTGSGAAIGYNALHNNTTGSSNIGIGYMAGYANQTSNSNTAIGVNTLVSNTAGSNTAVGSNALFANTTGNFNTAVGTNTLVANTTGIWNVTVGSSSMNKNISGNKNVAMGINAYTNQTVGDDNVAIGDHSMFGRTGGVTPPATWSNTFIGKNSAYFIDTAVGNTGIGRSSLYNISRGTYNVAIGDSAGVNITIGSSNIVIGAYTNVLDGTQNGQLAIGNYFRSDVTGTKLGVFTTNPQATLDVNGDVKISGTLTLASVIASLDFPNTNGNSSSDLTVNYTGAADGDVVSLGVSNVAILPGCVYMGWVSAPGVVTIRLANLTNGAEDPPVANFKIRVVK